MVRHGFISHCASIHLRVTSANLLRRNSWGSISNSFPSQILKSPLNQLRDAIASEVTFKDGPQEVLTFLSLFFLATIAHCTDRHFAEVVTNRFGQSGFGHAFDPLTENAVSNSYAVSFKKIG